MKTLPSSLIVRLPKPATSLLPQYGKRFAIRGLPLGEGPLFPSPRVGRGGSKDTWALAEDGGSEELEAVKSYELRVKNERKSSRL
jgi:hypothetical protein